MFLHTPKECRTKGICQYGNDCANKHEKENNHSTVNKEVPLKHDADICAMKKKLHQLKVLIMQWENPVELLNQEIQKDKQTNIAEEVQIVVSMLDNAKNSEKVSPSIKGRSKISLLWPLWGQKQSTSRHIVHPGLKKI